MKPSEAILEPNPNPDSNLHRLIGKLSLADNEILLEVALALKEVPEPYFYNVDGVCKLLNISRPTLYRRIRAGIIKPVDLYIRRTIFEREEVHRHLMDEVVVGRTFGGGE